MVLLLAIACPHIIAAIGLTLAASGLKCLGAVSWGGARASAVDVHVGLAGGMVRHEQCSSHQEGGRDGRDWSDSHRYLPHLSGMVMWQERRPGMGESAAPAAGYGVCHRIMRPDFQVGKRKRWFFATFAWFGPYEGVARAIRVTAYVDGTL